MWGYFCIGFIDFIFKSKTLTDFAYLFSPISFNKNDDIILKYFMTNVKKWLNAICMKHIIYVQILIQFH